MFLKRNPTPPPLEPRETCLKLYPLGLSSLIVRLRLKPGDNQVSHKHNKSISLLHTKLLMIVALLQIDLAFKTHILAYLEVNAQKGKRSGIEKLLALTQRLSRVLLLR